MKDGRFDSVARSLAFPTRRGALLLAGIALCGLGGILGRSEAETSSGGGKRDRRRKRRRARRRQRRQPGPPLYPDLQTLMPSDLEFAQLGDGTHILRFTNTVKNAGEGRLELEAPTSAEHEEAGELYQNLYDAPVAGKRAGRGRVQGRIIYHDQHQHYHFADFASYQLLERDDAGVYTPLGEGTKTSFCIIDSARLSSPYSARYVDCERKRQGLTPGWGDTYTANLFEQWVALGDAPLADGEYGLTSTADPRSLLAEGGEEREQNNAATAYFTVERSQISNVREAP
jgi:hypothetical protein